MTITSRKHPLSAAGYLWLLWDHRILLFSIETGGSYAWRDSTEEPASSGRRVRRRRRLFGDLFDG
ncbi:MAG: hypothetical protein WBW33_27795 [Bryobacteraceae bacterium]